MTPNQYGEPVYSESDLCDLVMSGQSINKLQNLLVDHSVNLDQLKLLLDTVGSVNSWNYALDPTSTVEQFDQQMQSTWHMPDKYYQLDIAEYVLSLCTTTEQLQRVGEELLLYQERGLFDLLRYLKYLVDIMKQNNIIWGVGRGSSVASYVLYLLGVHRIDSMFYDLDPREFLR
jgi:DNA polymerase III alpha subunit